MEIFEKVFHWSDGICLHGYNITVCYFELKKDVQVITKCFENIFKNGSDHFPIFNKLSMSVRWQHMWF